MRKRSSNNKVVNYYSRFGTWAGYTMFLGRSQHFGYYDDKTRTEKQAQSNMLKLIADSLRIEKGMQVLDAGCGQGFVEKYLASKIDASFTGITITPREVKVATKQLNNKSKGSVEFLLADYHELPFDDNSFDIVFTVETLAHARNLQQVLSELYRVLKPGGKIVLFEYEWDYKNFSPKYKKIYDFAKKYWGGYGDQFPPGWAKNKLSKQGFKNFSEQDITKNVKPSMDRIRKLTKPIRNIVRVNEKIAKHAMNNMAGELYSLGVEEKVFSYKIFTAKK
jgi:ubiquinone/menaquinone biosynthesis C-methylase UbiE